MSYESKNQFYAEIARMSALLLSSILAMLVFMLIVGVQNPATNIKPLLSAALISLGASLIICVFGNIFAERTAANTISPKKSGVKDLKSRSDKMSKRLGIFRLFQQGVFIVSIVSTVLLALAVTQFLYKPVPSPSPSPPSGASSQQQAPGESAEDHAGEGSAPQQAQPASPTP